MVKICKEPDCKKQPSFNVVGKTTVLYCSEHKKKGMVNVRHKSCIHPDCKKSRLFNTEGEANGLYCTHHKKKGMVNVRHKPCIHPDCKKRPTFNTEGETKSLYCFTHKKDGMVNVRYNPCIYPDCKVRPVFNVVGTTSGLYCAAHKLDEMVDVIHKRCIHPECKIIPLYNYEGESPALYCSVHKKDGMINVITPNCKSDWCSTHVKKKYDGYCLHCYMHLFPDKPVSCNYKTKESAVVEYIKTKFPNLDWISDKIINGGCSKRRPDMLLDLLYQIIIIEIDENQHIDYDCSCQNKRTMELSQDLGHRPIVFIRFNPDDYENSGTAISSCWGRNGHGICVVKNSKKSEWSQRLTALEEQIKYWLNPSNTTNKTIETIQLFYDV